MSKANLVFIQKTALKSNAAAQCKLAKLPELAMLKMSLVHAVHNS